MSRPRRSRRAGRPGARPHQVFQAGAWAWPGGSAWPGGRPAPVSTLVSRRSPMRMWSSRRRRNDTPSRSSGEQVVPEAEHPARRSDQPGQRSRRDTSAAGLPISRRVVRGRCPCGTGGFLDEDAIGRGERIEPGGDQGFDGVGDDVEGTALARRHHSTTKTVSPFARSRRFVITDGSMALPAGSRGEVPQSRHRVAAGRSGGPLASEGSGR